MLGLFYGTSTGNTKLVADRIRNELGFEKVELINIRDASPSDFERFDKIIIGCSTMGYGDLQDDWLDFWQEMDKIEMKGKTVALFGCGDQEIYPSTFADALGIMYDKILSRGAKVIGFTGKNGYYHMRSKAERDGKFCGLVIDEDNQHKKTEKRIHNWLLMIATELLAE